MSLSLRANPGYTRTLFTVYSYILTLHSSIAKQPPETGPLFSLRKTTALLFGESSCLDDDDV